MVENRNKVSERCFFHLVLVGNSYACRRAIYPKNVEKRCLYNEKSLEDVGKNHAFVMASE